MLKSAREFLLEDFTSLLLLVSVSKHGGSFVQNPTEATFAVLVHRMVLKAKNIIRFSLIHTSFYICLCVSVFVFVCLSVCKSMFLLLPL